MDKNQKLRVLYSEEGITTRTEFLKLYGGESAVPAICSNEACDYTDLMEPDQDEGWCPECETNTLVSGLILLGVI